MKHARDDYNERFQDAAGIVPEDEPVFLIRGQDEIGHAAVRAWAHLHQLNGGSDRAYTLAMRHADQMENWAKNVKGKKADVPDVPKVSLQSLGPHRESTEGAQGEKENA